MSGAYALDALNAEEAALVEAAMRESEDLHSEVVGLSDTAVALGMALPPLTPPPALRARLLDAIETTPQLAAAPVSYSQPESDPQPEVDAQPAADVEPVRTVMPVGDHVVRRRRRRMRPMAWLAVAAAAMVLFGGGFFVQRTLLEPQSEMTALIAAPDVQKAAAELTGGGVAKVYWSKSEHRTAVVLNGVAAPAGKVLQLWSIRGGVATSAGLYESSQHYALISGTPSSGEYLGVTVEPEGGSVHPTTQPIVKVKLSA
ncbi:MAG: anti-sigma factor [Acidobacteria bacterium]|nr:anti-sigma factor [Acidobacteriota bacterium]